MKVLFVLGAVYALTAFAGTEKLKINCQDMKGKELVEVKLETSDVFFTKDGMDYKAFLKDKEKLTAVIKEVMIPRAREKMEKPKAKISKIAQRGGFDLNVTIKTGENEDGDDENYFLDVHSFYKIGEWLSSKTAKWEPRYISNERDTHFAEFGHNSLDGYWSEKVLCTVF